MKKLLFIPQPVTIDVTEAKHQLSRNSVIILPADADDADQFAAMQLKNGIKASTGLKIEVHRRFADGLALRRILLVRADRDDAWLCGEDLPELPAQGYCIRITADRVLVVGADAAGLFYAVQTLRQLVDQRGSKLPGMSITDYPILPVRGVMLDISRGKVPTVKDLLQTVDLLASWKINQFQLYIEHTFAWPSHPEIGKGHGPLTPEDILIVDAACIARHIELVPNLQSFGHQGHMLNLERYQHLAESESKWTLSPAVPETYELLDELYAEFLPNFHSKLFNIDADETFDLGKGKSAKRVAEVGKGRVYLEHLLKVRELAQKYGRKIMFWGDIILDYPELIAEIPEDVITLQWDYGHEGEDRVRPFAEAGKRFYLCPGTNSWNNYFPAQQVMRDNVSIMTEYAVKFGAEGLLNTDWGDGGHYNLQGVSYYAYAYGAAQSWNFGKVEHFDDAFGRLFFGLFGDQALNAIHYLESAMEPAPGVLIQGAVTMHQKCLQGEVYRELLKPEYTEKMVADARHAHEILASKTLYTRQPLVVQELYQAAYQQLLLSMKARTLVAFHHSYKEMKNNGDVMGFITAVDLLVEDLQVLIKMAVSVPEMVAPLWRARAHKAGLKPVQEYQMEVAEEMEATIVILRQMCAAAQSSGEVPALPPIDNKWQPKVMDIQMGICP